MCFLGGVFPQPSIMSYLFVVPLLRRFYNRHSTLARSIRDERGLQNCSCSPEVTWKSDEGLRVALTVSIVLNLSAFSVNVGQLCPVLLENWRELNNVHCTF